MATPRTTTDHRLIRQWVEAHGGSPAVVLGTEGEGDLGLLRIAFPGQAGNEDLRALSWEDFFERFDRSGLVFLYQQGQETRFSRLVRQLDEDTRDVLQLIRQQHREVHELFEELFSADDDDRGELFVELAEQLTLHATAEEQLFYPALAKEESRDRLLEALEEHLVIRRLLTDVARTRPESDLFEARLSLLCELVERHVKEEETELFAIARRRLDRPQRVALAEEMLALQERLRQTGQVEETLAGHAGEAPPLP